MVSLVQVIILELQVYIEHDGLDFTATEVVQDKQMVLGSVRF